MTIGDDELDELRERVIGCAMEVHRALGPGLLESIYRHCLLLELTDQGLSVGENRPVPIRYKGRSLAVPLRLDLVVDDCLVVELKAVEALHPVHLAQVITYLKLSGYPAGLLLNFNTTSLRQGVRRLVHPDRFVRRNGADGHRS